MKDVDKLYGELLENFKKKGYVNPKAMLDYRLKQLMEEGRTRGQAILHFSFHPEEEKRLEAAEKQTSGKAEISSSGQQTADGHRVKELEEKIARMTVLFSSGEIGEESYKTALRTLENELKDLKPNREPFRVKPRQTLVDEISSDLSWKPSPLWYLLPFLFGLLGGIVAYIGLKDDDEEMANNILIFSVVMTAVLTILWWIMLF